jgi:hypothetical protein
MFAAGAEPHRIAAPLREKSRIQVDPVTPSGTPGALLPVDDPELKERSNDRKNP